MTHGKKIAMYVFMLSIMPLALAQSTCPIDTANPCGAAPYFSIRSQGENAVREMVGWQELINLCGMDDFYGAVSVVGEYSESFRSNDIARVLFGSDFTNAHGCCGINITGSQVGNVPAQFPGFGQAFFPLFQRGPNDWLADYFGLPVFWQSTICFTPKIRNFVADVELYLGLSQWADGLYARVHMPITWTKWNLHAQETIIDPAINKLITGSGGFLGNTIDTGYPAGYFNFGNIERADLLDSALNFFNGTQAPFLFSESSPFIFQRTTNIVKFDKLACSKWNTCCENGSLSKTGVADLELVLGYNVVCTDNGYFGLNIRTAAPTGNHPCGEFLFEPIVGNGGSWQLGGGNDTHAVLWRGEHDNTLSFYLDANLTHLFKACQKRCFDLCGKPNSRYMLAQRLTTNTVGLAGDTIFGDTTCTDSNCTPSDAQFDNELSPVANLTMTKVKVSAAVQGDIALKFTYNNGNGFSYDLGYNFFGRSCEKICRVGNTPLTDGNTWALKGGTLDSVYGTPFGHLSAPIPLAVTESCATIHQTPQFNIVDNAEFAIQQIEGTNLRVTSRSTGRQVSTSIQPVFLTEADVDLQGTRIISNKIFTHFNYSWINRETWVPFLGFGASIEVAHHKQDPVSENCCPSCRSTHASQGAIWIKGGAAWN